MRTSSLRLPVLLTIGSLALTAPACGTDDAAERDVKDAKEQVDREAGNADEKAGKAAEDAADDAEKAVEDVDGK